MANKWDQHFGCEGRVSSLRPSSVAICPKPFSFKMETTITCAYGAVEPGDRTWLNRWTGKWQAICSVHGRARNVATMIRDTYGGWMCRYDTRHTCYPAKHKHYEAPAPTPEAETPQAPVTAAVTGAVTEGSTEALIEADAEDSNEACGAIDDGNNWSNWIGGSYMTRSNTRWNRDTDWSYDHSRWTCDNSWSYGANWWDSDPAWWNCHSANYWSGRIDEWWDSDIWRWRGSDWSWGDSLWGWWGNRW